VRGLLSCSAVYSGRYAPRLRKNQLPPLSEDGSRLFSVGLHGVIVSSVRDAGRVQKEYALGFPEPKGDIRPADDTRVA
jgi:hypothetical protein